MTSPSAQRTATVSFDYMVREICAFAPSLTSGGCDNDVELVSSDQHERRRLGIWRYLLTDTSIRLLKHYGMDLSDESRRVPMLTDGDQVAGVVVFEGDRIRGGLTVCAPRLLLGIASPTRSRRAIPLADFAASSPIKS